MDDEMNVPTPVWVATLEEREKLRQAWEKSREENAALRAKLNFWQMLGQSGLGNFARIVKEMQEILRDSVLEEGAKKTNT